MRDWHYKIRGLRQHLSEDVSDEAIRKSATGVTGVLEAFVQRLKKRLPETNRKKWEVEDYGIEQLEEIIEEMKDAGGLEGSSEPDLEWCNNVLAAMWDWCDGYNVWIETDHPETGL